MKHSSRALAGRPRFFLAAQNIWAGTHNKPNNKKSSL